MRRGWPRLICEIVLTVALWAVFLSVLMVLTVATALLSGILWGRWQR